MTDLSPAAAAVLKKFEDSWEADPYEMDVRALGVALRAAANQVVPPSLETEFYDPNASLALQEAVWIRTELLAIANELEQLND
jgi:hypothetical protein